MFEFEIWKIYNIRKAREAYLTDRGQTLEPLGLNRRDETWDFFQFFILRVFFCIFLSIFPLSNFEL